MLFLIHMSESGSTKKAAEQAPGAPTTRLSVPADETECRGTLYFEGLLFSKWRMRLAPQTPGVGEHKNHVPLVVGLWVVRVSGVHHRPMNKTFKSDHQAEGLGTSHEPHRHDLDFMYGHSATTRTSIQACQKREVCSARQMFWATGIKRGDKHIFHSLHFLSNRFSTAYPQTTDRDVGSFLQDGSFKVSRCPAV